MNEMELDPLKDLLIYILECIEGEPASTYFAGLDDPEAKSATIVRLKSCGDDLNAYLCYFIMNNKDAPSLTNFNKD